MNSGSFEEEQLRRWLSRHPAMQWPQDMAFDASRVWTDIARAPSRRPRHEHRWAFGVLALTAAMAITWLSLSSPRASRTVRQQHPASVATLRPTRPVLTGPVSELSMTGLNTGWALTQGQQVLRTVSGGQRWQRVTPPGLAGSTGALVRLAALGSHRAWVAVDRPHQAVVIERTVDGGRYWSTARIAPITFGGGGVRMDFVSANVGWVEVLTAGNASPSAALYGTVNGGASWRELSTSTSSGQGHLPFGGTLAFASAQDGLVVGAARAAGQVPWRYYVAQTRNGGHTWNQVTLPEPSHLASVSSNAIQVLPPVVVSGSLVLLPVIYSHSGGASTLVTYAETVPTGVWTVRGTLTVPTFRGTLKGPDRPLVTFATANAGWAIVNGALYRTTDGGRTWNVMQMASRLTAWMALYFVSVQAGWALDTAGRMWYTVNAGATWTQASR